MESSDLKREQIKRERIGVAIVGAAGRMSRAVIRLLEQKPQNGIASSDFKIIGGIEQMERGARGERGVYAQLGEVEAFVQDETCAAPLVKSFSEFPGVRDGAGDCGVDVAVDFSRPQATLTHLQASQAVGVGAWVIGTTGFSEAETALLREYAQRCVIVRSGNFSKGIHALLPLLREAAKLLGSDCDIEIVEAHHQHKQDAPSGTAKMLASTLAEVRDLDLETQVVYGRSGTQARRNPGEIGISAVRGGGIIGEHSVHFIEQDEQILIKHTAFNRMAFTSGIPSAIRFAQAKRLKNEFGYYEMSDVMNYFK